MTCVSGTKSDPQPGFEPGSTGPEPVVLPLHHRGVNLSEKSV